MKVDVKTKDLLIRNLKEWFATLCCEINLCIEEIEKAETVEEVMYYKKKLLLDYLCVTPLSSTTCYFCIYEENFCEGCLYARYHKPCGETGSDYYEIKKALRRLINLIDEKYYSGEKYEE